jgi:hypothetical protein
MSQPKVLIFVHFNSYFYNLFGVAKVLKNSGKFKPVMMFVTRYPLMAKDIEQCELHGIVAVNSENQILRSQEIGIAETKPRKVKVASSWIVSFLKRNLLEPKRIFTKIAFWKNRLSELESLFKRENVKVLVLGGDIAGTDTAAVIKAGHSCRIPSVAFVNWLGKYEAASIYRANPEHQLNSLVNIYTAIRYPKWTHVIDGRKFLRLPGPEILAIEKLKMAPANPWVLHSGEVDAIAVEGDVMRDAALEMGLAEKKVFSTGSMQNDEMKVFLDLMGELRKKLYADLSITNDKPMLLTALPPDFLYEVAGKPQCPDCDFQNYHELAEFWMKALAARTNYQVIVSLHPSVNREQYNYLEQFGVRISEKRISELIPLCDLFVACVSATINWAIASGKPVINYDVYRYHYTDYTSAKGVITVQDQEDFLEILGKLTGDQQFLNEVLVAQKNESTRWARLDGKTGERINTLIESLIS